MRGVVSFVSSLVLGMRSLLRSSEVAVAEDEEPSKLTKWMAEHWKISVGEIVTTVSTVLGVVIAVLADGTVCAIDLRDADAAISRFSQAGDVATAFDLLHRNEAAGNTVRPAERREL